MDSKICSSFVRAFFTIIVLDIADHTASASNAPIQSVFVFSHYKKIEEVKNYRILTKVYVHDLSPADKLQLCSNVARSTYFKTNGYRLIRGVSADRQRNYRVSYTRFGKRDLIAAFKCPMDPPVFVQHTGEMVMVYLKKPKNYGCSDEDSIGGRSTSGRSSWFHNFFRRAKLFFGLKPYERVRDANDFLCLGKGLGISHTADMFEDDETARSNRHEEHFVKHALHPWILSRVKFRGNRFYGIDSIGEIIDELKNGLGGLHEGDRFRISIRPDDRQGTAVSGSNFDSGTSLQQEISSKIFDSNAEQQQGFSKTSNIQSKLNQGLVDQGGEITHFQSHILPDKVTSSVNVQSDVLESDLASRVNFGKSAGLKPTDGSIDFVADDERRRVDVFEVHTEPKLDTADRIHSEESEFGSISSLPLGRL